VAEFQVYPGGQLAIGNGVREHVSDAKLDADNGAALVHMLASSPSGWKMGNREISGSFDGQVPAEGEEADYLNLVMLGKPQTFRFKIPNSVKIIEGVLKTLNYTMAAGDSTKYSVNFIGRVKNA
jgi:hypothetical protein